MRHSELNQPSTSGMKSNHYCLDPFQRKLHHSKEFLRSWMKLERERGKRALKDLRKLQVLLITNCTSARPNAWRPPESIAVHGLSFRIEVCAMCGLIDCLTSM